MKSSILNPFKNIYAKKELIWFLSKTSILSRYKQALLGIFWAFLQPLLIMTLFSIIGKILNLSSEGVPRPIFYYSAALPWSLFSSSISASSGSLVSNSNLVRQVYFPREILPFSTILVSLIDFIVAFLIFVGMLAYYKIGLNIYMLYLPLLVFIQLLFIMSISLLFAALNVAFRDVKLVINSILQIWMYATPILYSIAVIPSKYIGYYYLNPMAGIIDSYRKIFVHGNSPNHEGLMIGFSVSFVLFIIIYPMFRKAEDIFADII